MSSRRFSVPKSLTQVPWFPWCKGPSRPIASRPGALSTSERLIYAIGDVHGRSDLLTAMLDRISDDALAQPPAERPVIVLLGDYVDRGSDSRGVLDRLLRLRDDAGFELRALRGNHEEQMLSFLEDAAAGAAWLEFGGAQTMSSYGVVPPRQPIPDQLEEARAALIDALPPSHLQLLQSLELTATYGDYLFVHAGLRPDVALADQREHDLLWIRDEFLNASTPFEKVVVHGHTPEASPIISELRIGIDTGAYATGCLTAVRLQDDKQSLIQVSG